VKRKDQVRVSLRSVEGCGSNGQKNSVNRRLFTKTGDCLQNSSVGKFETSGPQNSVASVAKCWRQKRFRGDL